MSVLLILGGIVGFIVGLILALKSVFKKEKRNKKAMITILSSFAAAILGFVLLANEPTDYSNDNTPVENNVSKPKEAIKKKVDKEIPKYTVNQENAISSAESYLEMGGFSKQGLIDQLIYEKFSKEDATFAAEHVKVDWNEQAYLSAKSYLDNGGFSKQGLIEQLMYEKFTKEQAEYGVSKTGLK